MPTMRRTRGTARSDRTADSAATVDTAPAGDGAGWASTSPLSSISTPASSQQQQQQTNRSNSGDEDAGAVNKLLTQAAQAIEERVGAAKHRRKGGSRAGTPVHTAEQLRRLDEIINQATEPNPNAAEEGVSTDDEETERDAAGELKIDSEGRLLGGRTFICPIFRSPFRRNKVRQYVLTMDCCRYVGARDSYMLFKQHPYMRRVETSQEERDLLADRKMIPKVTRFRPIAMVTARTAFRTFGARIVKDGRYITDDYWEAKRRSEMKHAEGTLVANMDVYRDVSTALAAGVTPGSTRKARKPIRQRKDSTPKTPRQHAKSPFVRGQAAPQQQLYFYHQGGAPALFAPQPSAPPQPPVVIPPQHSFWLPPSGLVQPTSSVRPADVAEMQRINAAVADPLCGLSIYEDASRDLPRVEPRRFPKTRAPELAEALFEGAASVHRGLFSDDMSFVDGTPLLQSLAPPQPHKARGATGGSGVAREFNGALRAWREANGSTWVDPHTGIRQVAANRQPERSGAEKTGGGKRRCIERDVAFEKELGEEDLGEEGFPLAVLPGQFQGRFPLHLTRFGRTYRQEVDAYNGYWRQRIERGTQGIARHR